MAFANLRLVWQCMIFSRRGHSAYWQMNLEGIIILMLIVLYVISRQYSIFIYLRITIKC